MVTFYWRCCSEEEKSAESLSGARASLEEHEREKHKEKPIGSFGWKRMSLEEEILKAVTQ